MFPCSIRASGVEGTFFAAVVDFDFPFDDFPALIERFMLAAILIQVRLWDFPWIWVWHITSFLKKILIIEHVHEYNRFNQTFITIITV